MSLSVPLRLEGISKRFGHVQALKPLTLDVRGGEMLALLGPSGCGKTTTLRIIAGFETPDEGSVLIGEKDITELPPNKRSLGMVFQNYCLFPHLTVGENVAFGLKMRGIPAADRAKRVRAMLELMRLGNFEERTIHQLSGGQQQRVALARSLVTDPSLLLLDEPLGALDKNLRERMQFELREIQRRLGITSILVTHDQEEALTMSDRVAVMEAGAIIQIGAPTEVYERPHSQFVSEFLGTANIFHAVVLRRVQQDMWAVRLEHGKAEMLIACAANLASGGAVKIAVRPERLKMDAPAGGGMPAMVRDVVFRGSYYAYELSIADQASPIFVYTQARKAIPADGEVTIDWSPESAILLADQAAP
ncbi:MAG TPA: ABC transporter ATP-binding protein [Rhodopila sp.]|uniref:ABC transporter ATP-binding protein n=1 Tax=Rhodopila sp. TaxID=2480087 RepID=UPI002D0857AC|nr:ABC transporter ATP-binding protein [Rhodopila sp.]HVY16735.1 ABC transporter ATP-binding protein [Rhodopila sp.]